MSGGVRVIREDFAGPGGWDEGFRWLGGRVDVGVEFNAGAAATAVAAGHNRVVADVRSVRSIGWTGLEGYIASPPCQTFSVSGNGNGRLHLTSLVSALGKVAAGEAPEEAVTEVADGALDERSLLVLEPMLVVRDWTPTWVAMEQVPAALPVWEEYASVLRAMGYFATAGIVHAEAYGVPQTRKRAVLVAHREREVSLPAPTHSRFRTSGALDVGVPRWVGMRQVLPHLPAHARQRSNYSAGGPGRTAAERGRTMRSVSEPALTVTGKAWQWELPHRVTSTVAEAGVLQTFPEAYPWQGGVSAARQQVGDAIPPRLAEAVLAGLV